MQNHIIFLKLDHTFLYSNHVNPNLGHGYITLIKLNREVLFCFLSFSVLF